MYLFAAIAGAIAWYFVSAAFQRPRPGVIIAAIVWLLYVLYEVLIGIEVLCEAKCNIRIDIFLVWPLLLLASLFGLNPPGEWNGAAKVLAGLVIAFLAFMVAAFAYMAIYEAGNSLAVPDAQTVPAKPVPK